MSALDTALDTIDAVADEGDLRAPSPAQSLTRSSCPTADGGAFIRASDCIPPTRALGRRAACVPARRVGSTHAAGLTPKLLSVPASGA